MKQLLNVFLTVLFFNAALAQSHKKEFTNPLLPSGADPWVIYHTGYYYYTSSKGDRIVLYKTKNMADLKSAKEVTVWTPPPNTSYSKEIWAPELHFINHKWYLYFAADEGSNNNHRIYVLENASADPQLGNWTFKGKISDATNKWAIDASVFENKGKLYMIWAGWEGDENGQQNIYIAQLKNPWTVGTKRVKISSPTYNWEKYGDLHDSGNPPHVNVNEGPEILKHNNKLFLVYSASGCWTDYYALGMLSASTDKNLLDSASWTKSAQPVFKQSPENGVYAPGHNSFFKSADGKEDWILYHANSQPGQGCGKDRSPRMQKFSWNADGTPDFGTPVKEGIYITAPSQ
ncbi:glycoside hydrolase family 43 protein [Mucilaginibacter xinganensis]|uniref:Glycosyl hydrolase family 43 n=1 Tax=Mucilaginibacter xinganensis TaxID=1234841 RepID=A0A223NZ77_9SPHI|nr:glycoside hydrolase family 43 protein [Mucilaginibacter xinganensis]ASU35014.1 glycosyl hydrolase family 43 [Mucilaginibacter xinganensis]